MRNSVKIFLMFVVCVILAVSALLLNRGSEFGGADGTAEEIILEIAPDTEPWAEPVLEPPGSETESLLFALQAAVGAGALGLGFGYLIGRKKASK